MIKQQTTTSFTPHVVNRQKDSKNSASKQVRILLQLMHHNCIQQKNIWIYQPINYSSTNKIQRNIHARCSKFI
jgi:hypothetical protein